MTYLDMQRPGEAQPYLERSLKGSAPTDSIVRKLYYLIVQCHRQMSHPDLALEAGRRGRQLYPLDAELLGQEASLLVEKDDLAGARICYERLLTTQESAHFASVPIGLHGYLSRHNLAIVSLRQNRLAEAESLWREVISEKPEFEPAWAGLEDLLVQQARWSNLESLAAEIATRPDSAHQAALTRARGQLARGEFGTAKQVLRSVMEAKPDLLRPRVLLSHALLQEGTDLVTAENVLVEILTRAPEFTEARQNLELVRLRQRGQGGPM
jgi:Tfp pilus assembly protein PilF